MNQTKRTLKLIIHKCMISGIILLFSFLLLFLSKKENGFAQWYSVHIYPLWVSTVGRIVSPVPFSVSEFLLYGLAISGIFFMILFLVRVVQKKTRMSRVFVGLLTYGEILSVLFLFYTLNCGVNYYRRSFSEESKIITSAYTKEDLANLCRHLTEDINHYGTMINRNEDGLCTMTPDYLADARTAMNALGEQFTEMKGYYPKPKMVTVSTLLSAQNLTGIFSPFTIEANFNGAMPDYNIPFTVCHELSHLRGYMQEQEANFIAYLACQASNIPEYQYSGSLIAWVYSTNVLYRLDPDTYWELRDSLLPEARLDLNANNTFWKQYNETKVAKAAAKVNDTYLKVNGQTDGVKSYNRMVDLLIAYENQEY